MFLLNGYTGKHLLRMEYEIILRQLQRSFWFAKFSIIMWFSFVCKQAWHWTPTKGWLIWSWCFPWEQQGASENAGVQCMNLILHKFTLMLEPGELWSSWKLGRMCRAGILLPWIGRINQQLQESHCTISIPVPGCLHWRSCVWLYYALWKVNILQALHRFLLSGLLEMESSGNWMLPSWVYVWL